MFQILKDLLFGQNRMRKIRCDQQKLTRSLEHNRCLFKDIFQYDDTVICRELETEDQVRCLLIFVDGMVDKEVVQDQVIRPIVTGSVSRYGTKEDVLSIFTKRLLFSEEIKITDDLDQITTGVLYGDSLLLIEGVARGIIIGSKGWQSRAVLEPLSERVVRGSREGFCESLNVNLALVRRRLKDSDLKFRRRQLGFRTKTDICIAYIEGLASEPILQEVERRLNQIKIDGILETGYIEEFIKDSPLSPFKTIGHTERPDIVVAKLLEGRVAIFCDGTPFALTLPFIFLECFQANEDYYRSFFFSSFNRLTRYIAFVLSTITPAVYSALVTYHQEMIPTPLLLSISAARQGVPFPTVVEAVLLGFMFELLREGGVRLPTPIGQAVSIVGAIVLGEAAVSAKIVSAPVIIVTALTGISGFLLPQIFGLILMLRLILLLLAFFFGFYGIMFGVIGFFIQAVSMRSFGVPYMLYWGAVRPQDLKDTVIRAPWWYMHLRPKLIGKRDPERQPDRFPPKRGADHE